MDSVFLKLVAGSMISNHMRLVMEPGYEYQHGKGYLFLEIPVGAGVDTVDGIKRNQHVYIAPAATVDVKGRYIVHVEPNPALAEFGQVQAPYNIHPESGLQTPGFWFTARKDLDLNELKYAVRLYMYA